MASELKNKFVFQFLLSASQVLLPLISYPYITRVLGPANLGIVNYADFLSQLFIIFAAFGIPFYAVRELAVVKHNPEKRATLIKEIGLLHLIFSICSTLIFILVTFNYWSHNLVLYLLASFNIFISALSFDWYIQGMEAFKFAAIRSLLLRIAMLFAFFIFIKTAADYSIYFGVFSAATFIIAVVNSYKLFSENRLGNQPVYIKKHLKPLWHFFLTSSAISIYIYFDTILLQLITHNAKSVGYYTAVLKMVKICLLMMLTIGTVLMPRLSFLVSTGNKEAIKNYLDKSMQLILLTGIPVGFGFIFLAPEIILTIAGDKFLPAIPVMRILAFLPLTIGLSNIFCFQTLIPFNQEKKFLTAVIIGCVASVGLNLLLIPILKESGAAWANITTEIIITIITGFQAFKIIRFNPCLPVVIQTVVATVLFIPVIFICKFLFTNAVIILLVAIPLCGIIYFMVQFLIFKNQVAREMKEYVWNLLNL